MDSAGCSSASDMGYMTRLGLWGIGTNFPGGFDEFRAALNSSGMGMM